MFLYNNYKVMANTRWTKYRVLVTNTCNYRCPFCHNEGQEKQVKADLMSLDDFKRLVDLLSTEDIEELNISGGEPFVNKYIVDMIDYADSHLTCDVSCATNLSLIQPEQIERLSKTRIKFNIQFPFVNEKAFHESTGNGELADILQNIKLVRDANIKIGLNTVVQNGNAEDYEQMIIFAIENELPLKLLPQIGGQNSDKYKEFIIPVLDKYSAEFKDKGCGALRWILEKDGHSTIVLYIDSPCFYHDIETCKNYAEIRIHPDLSVQTCILKQSVKHLNFEEGNQFVKEQLQELWKNFNHC